MAIPKCGKSRFIQICLFLCELPQKNKQKSDRVKRLVFPTTQGDYSANVRICRPFERLVKKTNVTKIRIHDMPALLWHSWMVLSTVQKWLGHKDIQTTMRYIRLLPEPYASSGSKTDIRTGIGSSVHSIKNARSEIQTEQKTLMNRYQPI